MPDRIVCLSDPVNFIDPYGLWYDAKTGRIGVYGDVPQTQTTPVPDLTKGQKKALEKSGIGLLLVLGGSVTLPEGAAAVATGIPMLAEGLTLGAVELGLHGDTSDIPSTWDVFGEIAKGLAENVQACPSK